MAKRKKRNAKAKKPRDYKAEYRARIERALKAGYSRRVARGHAGRGEISISAAKRYGVRPGSDPRDLIDAERKHVFGGRQPKRSSGESIAQHILRLQEAAQRDDGLFTWDDEAQFLEQMSDLGLSEREAYTTLFGS